MAVLQELVTLMTAEELAAPGVPEKFVELVKGELITAQPAPPRCSRIATNLAFIFRHFCLDKDHIDYFSDNYGFYVQRNPDTVLSPDAGLFRARPETGSTWMEFAPELVAQVLSPSNSKTEMTFKRHRFFEAGTEQFWLVDPEARTLQIYHRDGRTILFGEDAIVDGEGIAAGLECSLADLFATR